MKNRYDCLRSNRVRDQHDDRIREIHDRGSLQLEQARRKPREPEPLLLVEPRVLRIEQQILSILRDPRNPCMRFHGRRRNRLKPPRG